MFLYGDECELMRYPVSAATVSSLRSTKPPRTLHSAVVLSSNPFNAGLLVSIDGVDLRGLSIVTACECLNTPISLVCCVY